MEHRHPVTDTDARFEINTITRNIIAVSGKTALIQGDHNSERFTFALSSRRVDNHDMSLCNVVEIHYINIDATTKEQHVGVYDVTDMKVDPEDENKVILTWLISNNATRYAGSLNFAIKFKCVAEDGTVDYVWNSGIFKGINVSNGIDNGEAVIDGFSDILEQWRYELYENSKPSATISTVELLAEKWVGEANLFSQIVAIDGVGENSQVDLTPNVEQLVVFYEKDLTFVTENDGGVVTVYAIGQKPVNDYTIQVTITEVNA